MHHAAATLQRCRFARPTRPAGQGPRPAPRLLPPEPTRIRDQPGGLRRVRSGCRARFAAPHTRGGSDLGMAKAIASRRRAQECPPAVLSSRRTKVTAARDPHPPGGRDRRYRARGAGRVREHGDAAPFRPSGDLTAEHHGCHGRCCSLFVLIATPCGPASRPSLPAPALARSTLPATRVRVRHQGRRREAPAASF